MTTPLAVASNVTTYNARTPYLTAAEYKQTPTAVDTTNLVQGGSQAQNAAQLTTLVGRASAMVDQLCYGDQGCLAATLDIDGPKRLRVNKSGRLSVATRYRPVLQVNSVSLGLTPSQMVPFTNSAAGDLVILEDGIIEIPLYGLTPYAGAGVGSARIGAGSTVLVEIGYVNGYANTILGAPVAAGASSLSVQSALGIYPGQSLTIFDTDGLSGGIAGQPTANEIITVSTSYVIGASTIPLMFPTQYAHAAGISVSYIPPPVKQATILLASALIKTRGALAIVRGKVGTPQKATKMDSGVTSYTDEAEGLLVPFKRTWLTG